MDLISSWDGRGDHRQVSKQIVAGCFEDQSAWGGGFLQLVGKVFIENVTVGSRPERSKGVGHEETRGAVCQAGGGRAVVPSEPQAGQCGQRPATKGLLGHGKHLE